MAHLANRLAIKAGPIFRLLSDLRLAMNANRKRQVTDAIKGAMTALRHLAGAAGFAGSIGNRNSNILRDQAAPS